MSRIRRSSRPPSRSAPGASPAADPVRPESPARLVRALCDWFLTGARDLPWRRQLSAYGTWVSEIMLQQTQVKTVIPYWQRWMAALPDVPGLASARPDAVLKLWEGLGYYSRARRLHEGARVVLERHGGVIPPEPAALLALPGIGRYTAGAIGSIAFNQPAPILDGNVTRVLCRLFGIGGDPRQRVVGGRLWKLAEELVRAAAIESLRPPANRRLKFAGPCSVLNQALMELGATVCTPRQPRCGECPVGDWCVARREQRVEQLPELAARPAITPRRFVAVVIDQGRRFLVRRRPAGGVNAGLWEFPNCEIGATDDALARSEALGRELLGAHARPPAPFQSLRHSITRYRITLEVFRIAATAGAASQSAAGRCRWVGREDLDTLAFTGAHRRIAAALAAPAA